MKRRIAALALLLTLPLTGCSVSGLSFDGCGYDRTHTASIPTDGVKSVRIDGWAGDLTVRGQEGATALSAKGVACASRQSVVDQIGLKTERSGDTVVVTVLHPDSVVGSAYLNLSIDLPTSLTAKVKKSSGATTIENLAALEIEKGSGDLTVRTIKGDLQVETRSGAVRLQDVTGATTYEGSSGDLTMQDLKGKVTIVDKSSGQVTATRLGNDLVLEHAGSGDMVLREIAGSIRIGRKSSGAIQVSDVGGSFSADDVNSGTLELRQIKGDVLIKSKSSGTVTISGIGKSVRLDGVGSGTLTIKDVQGDLVVKEKSSGTFTYDRIQGKVDVPRK
jgi:DUF4097 and DUF4098 domain-containing protein YvlB